MLNSHGNKKFRSAGWFIGICIAQEWSKELQVPSKARLCLFLYRFYTPLIQQSAASAVFIRFGHLWANAFQISTLKYLIICWIIKITKRVKKRFLDTSGHKIRQRISLLLLPPSHPKQSFSILKRSENNPIHKVKIGSDFLTSLPPPLDNLEMKINSCLRACEELIIALDQSTKCLLFLPPFNSWRWGCHFSSRVHCQD